MKSIAIFGAIVALTLLAAACSDPSPTPVPPTPTPRPTPNPGPVVYSDTVTINSGVAVTVPIPVSELNRVQGQLEIRSDDVAFRIIDPNRNTIVNAGRVSETHGFSFIASTRGSYQMVFDNGYSFFTNKVVTYNVTVHHR